MLSPSRFLRARRQSMLKGTAPHDMSLRGEPMTTLSMVIPALNERENIDRLFEEIPFTTLAAHGWEIELLVVDNGSTDGTARAARLRGARVLVQPVRGYGNAYKLGFANALGDVFVTGDADLTYPFDMLPQLLGYFEEHQLDFLSTNRLIPSNRDAMKGSHALGNHVLSAASSTLFHAPFKDSQSGMWILRRYVWEQLDVRSPGMAFSQELKHEAFLKEFRCGEVDIEYRTRGGTVKLNASRDGVRNLVQLATHRARAYRHAGEHHHRQEDVELKGFEDVANWRRVDPYQWTH
jgi:glycosyltransferase involved in cell wall biosynthesis